MRKIGIKFNPFYLYSLTVLSILVLYNLGWSNIYPKLSLESYIFLISTIVIAVIVGLVLDKKFVAKESIEKNRLNLRFLTIIVFIGFIIEFIYEGQIPIIEILVLKSDFNYLGFAGIPTFHVLLITFNSFIAIYTFNRYLEEKNKEYLILFILNLIPSMLIFNRGMLTMILLSCASVYILCKMNGFLDLKTVSILLVLGLIFIYMFGILGNLRSNKDYHIGNDITNSEYIMIVGDASDRFRDSIIPKPFYWGYIYITSPLANLEKTIQSNKGIKQFEARNISQFLMNSILPDFVSNDFSVEPGKADLISPALTVSTFYSQGYLSLGWLGMVFLFLYWLVVVILYRFIVPYNSSFFISGLAIINTITMVNFFDNMLVFAGLSFQLVYPILFMIFIEKEYGKKFLNYLKIKLNYKQEK
ncbi:hypothetical protein [Paraclostridium bifermentans]|uniref:hypothetical protein n=1 Tax=Paraclostridium bifermentans TaxID=1490 RepID=UPI00290BCAA9|nr:hypothetical protein [Paraclostridium bifermentans]MDU3338236.1 hypothetical protein [Paraclostridium bifermentans]